VGNNLSMMEFRHAKTEINLEDSKVDPQVANGNSNEIKSIEKPADQKKRKTKTLTGA
jgi:hypothetical protein